MICRTMRTGCVLSLGLIASLVGACGDSAPSETNRDGGARGTGGTGGLGGFGDASLGGFPDAGGALQDVIRDDSRAGYCAGQGPPVRVGDQGDAQVGTTTGCIASWAFRSAVCACDNIEIAKRTGATPAYFRTDSWNSATGPYTPGTAGIAGRVGCVSTYAVQADSDIGGDLVLNSDTALFQQFRTRVRADFRTKGGVLVNTGSGELAVDRDAWITGLLAVETKMAVSGTLYRGPGAVSIGSGSVSSPKATVSTIFTVEPACACGPGDLLDVAGYVKASQSANDNADIGLLPGALTSLSKDATFTLPCGRFYVSGITVPDHDVTFVVQGRTALMVDGPVIAHGLTVTLATDAELDLFVADNFLIQGPLELGGAARPRAVRVYVGGSGNLVLTGQQALHGNLYAPHASIITDPELEVYGSLFANVIVGERLGVHFDSAVRTVGQGCGERPPPPPR